jgi:hypothetical protein
MKCPSPEKIEKYIIESFFAIENAEMENHIEECRFCAEIYQDLMSFYKKFQKELMEGFSSIPESLSFSKPIYGSFASTIGPKKDGDITLAAAKGQSLNKVPLELIAVFSTEDENLLLRLFHDTDSGEYQLSLIAEDPALYQYVLVSNEHLDKTFVSDACGRIVIGDIEFSDPKALVFHVQTADIIYTLNALKVRQAMEKIPDNELFEIHGAVNKKMDVQITKPIDLYDITFIDRSEDNNSGQMLIGSEADQLFHPNQLSSKHFGFTRIPLQHNFVLRVFLPKQNRR